MHLSGDLRFLLNSTSVIMKGLEDIHHFPYHGSEAAAAVSNVYETFAVVMFVTFLPTEGQN